MKKSANMLLLLFQEPRMLVSFQAPIVLNCFANCRALNVEPH